MALEFKQSALIKLNLRLFLEEILLRENAFTNVTSGTLFYDNVSDMSQLLPDATAHENFYGLSVGQVFQSPYRNWVHQSGTPLDGTTVSDPPRNYSGVYVEGSLRGPGDPDFAHTVDYLNGRIIFATPQSLDLKVFADFAVHENRINFEHAFNQEFQESVLQTKFSNNPLTSYQIIYPSGLVQPFPAVFIENKNRDLEGYEMGNRSLIIKDTIRLHVWTQNDIQRDNIVDVLTAQMRKVIPIIDFNKAPLPLSGIHNTLSFEYIPYPTLLKNNTTVTTVGSGIPVRYLAYIDNVTAQTLPGAETYERSIVDYNISVYLNAPNTPLASKLGPISALPTIEGLLF